MPGWLSRLLGSRASAQPDYWAGPKLAGLDPVSERAIELQKAYWRLDDAAQAEREQLEGRGLTALDWPEALRLHHLRCLVALDADDGSLRRRLLAATPPERTGDVDLAPVQASAQHLLGRRSPFRPRHGFAWLGAGPPEGDDIPYSDFQGRVVGALNSLGALEVLTLDDSHAPAEIAFVAFDDIQTVSLAPTTPETAKAPFRAARILGEYGRPERIVLAATRQGLSWYGFDPELLRGAAERRAGAVRVRGLADPSRAITNPDGDRRELAIAAGRVRLEILSDDQNEGLGSFTLTDCYQLSLAIDQDDPRFADKCEGRGLDPEATRGDVVRESRLRASARAKRRDA